VVLTDGWEAYPGPSADESTPGLTHLRRIAAEQMAMYTEAPLPYTGPATGEDLAVLGRMERIATGPMAAAITASFRIDFQEQDPALRFLAEARGQHASRGPSADDDGVVVLAFGVVA
jgi:hypothetical protein